MAGKGVDNTFRRTWDKEKYEALAKERVEREEGELEAKGKSAAAKSTPAQATETLRQRTEEINLTKELGKTKVISQTATRAEQGGFYCETCDSLLKDSIAYLDHINGRKHQKNLGMSMKVERSSLEEVKAKLLELKKKKGKLKKKKKKKIYRFVTKALEAEDNA
eukprot:Nk52_evm18s279 gene=Nk52_evmTU18s279